MLYGRKLISLVLIMVLVFNLAACGGGNTTGDDRDSTGGSPANETEGGTHDNPVAADLMRGIVGNPVTGKTPDQAFISAMTDFGVKLFANRMLAEGEMKNENVLISPLSVMLALAMTANGAGGETRSQMEQFLGGQLTIQELNEYLYTYVQGLPQGENYKLTAANSIWVRDGKGISISRDFLQTNADYYGAAARKEAFDQNTVDQINGWVKDNTDGLIDSIINEIQPETILFLINALVFEAAWQRPYMEGAVKEELFTSVTGEERTVEMMFSHENWYLHDNKVTGFIKPYAGNQYSFVALLPGEGVDIDEYIQSMTGETVENLLNTRKTAEVTAKLPKFSYEDNTKLNKELETLGMDLALDSERADFSQMDENGDKWLYIGEILHKTFIEVCEYGTKAAAVTAVIVDAQSAMPPQETYEVILDRPFIYMIMDNITQIPIFIGAVKDIQ